MELAIVTHRFVKGDGQGRVNYEVARAAVRRGHRVTLLASEAAPELTALNAVTWIPIPVEGWPTALLRHQVFAWRTARWLARHRDRLDLVVANGFITWAAADVNAVHHVHSISRRSPFHAAHVRSGPYAWYQWLFSALNAWWEKGAFRKARVLVAVSDKVRDELRTIGMPEEAIQVIRNGVDVEEFSPGVVDRTALDLPSDVPLALFVGDIRTPGKNLDTVLKAARRVPDLHVAVAGSTEKSPYPQMADDLEIGERIHFLGYRGDVPDLMRAADLFAFPSRYEACSLVMLEALASGLPVITAQTAGGAEIVEEAGGTVLSDPGDTEALARALRTLLAEPDRLAHLSKGARATAKNYSWERMARQYLDLFEELCPPISPGLNLPEIAPPMRGKLRQQSLR